MQRVWVSARFQLRNRICAVGFGKPGRFLPERPFRKLLMQFTARGSTQAAFVILGEFVPAPCYYLFALSGRLLGHQPLEFRPRFG